MLLNISISLFISKYYERYFIKTGGSEKIEILWGIIWGIYFYFNFTKASFSSALSFYISSKILFDLGPNLKYLECLFEIGII